MFYKLCKSFKHLYQMHQILPIKVFYADFYQNNFKLINGRDEAVFDKNSMKKWNFKIQIFGEFIFARRKADDPYLLSRLFKYFWNCKISTCFITEQILTVAEYEKLVKVVERLHMKNVRIVDAKNELIPVEILLEIGINLRDFCLELRKKYVYFLL